MDVNFVWENENSDVTDIVLVDLLITKARTIFSDPFTKYEENTDENQITSHQMTEATESNVLLYSVTIHNLPLGVYHYMFKVTTKDKSWLEISSKEKQTVLGSRRRVNYIEPDIMTFSDCK